MYLTLLPLLEFGYMILTVSWKLLSESGNRHAMYARKDSIDIHYVHFFYSGEGKNERWSCWDSCLCSQSIPWTGEWWCKNVNSYFFGRRFFLKHEEVWSILQRPGLSFHLDTRCLHLFYFLFSIALKNRTFMKCWPFLCHASKLWTSWSHRAPSQFLLCALKMRTQMRYRKDWTYNVTILILW